MCLLFNNALNWQHDTTLVMVKISVMRWRNEDGGVKEKYAEENLSSYQIVRQKSLPWN
jgi:hypothetical protein